MGLICTSSFNGILAADNRKLADFTVPQKLRKRVKIRCACANGGELGDQIPRMVRMP